MTTLRLKKGMVLPFQDLLEMEIAAKLIEKSCLMKSYTIDKAKILKFIEGNHLGYYFSEGDGCFLLDDDYEIIIRKVSKKRQEKESIKNIKTMLSNNLNNK